MPGQNLTLNWKNWVRDMPGSKSNAQLEELGSRYAWSKSNAQLEELGSRYAW